MTLVLLPGMDGTGRLFAPFLRALDPDLDVRVIPLPQEPLGYPELIEHVRGELAGLGPYAVLAESFSGPIGISLAASRPVRLERLILCCSFVSCPLPFVSWLAPVVHALPALRPPAAVVNQFVLGRFANTDLGAALSRALDEVPPTTLRARLAAATAVDVSRELQRVDVPLLYLRARHDRLVPASALRRVIELKPDTQVAEFDAPHFLLQTVPHEAARLVQDFVGGGPSR